MYQTLIDMYYDNYIQRGYKITERNLNKYIREGYITFEIPYTDLPAITIAVKNDSNTNLDTRISISYSGVTGNGFHVYVMDPEGQIQDKAYAICWTAIGKIARN